MSDLARDGIVLLVTFDVRSERLSAFDLLLEKTINKIRELEPDTLVYMSASDRAQASKRVLVEVYRDSNAFATHERNMHVKEFLEQRGDLIHSFSVLRLTPVHFAFHHV